MAEYMLAIINCKNRMGVKKNKFMVVSYSCLFFFFQIYVFYDFVIYQTGGN